MANLTWKADEANDNVEYGFVADATNPAFTLTTLDSDDVVVEGHVTNKPFNDTVSGGADAAANVASAKTLCDNFMDETNVPQNGTEVNG
tara:strand:+ start:78435 stop:78701 length:267 start_codon:yes stop_codon:yes gene_type:complete